MKRLFAAIKVLPDAGFLEHYSAMKQLLTSEKIRWVEPENLHITLKFLGSTEERLIPSICNSLEAAAADTKAFKLDLHGAGIFGSSYNPRVIWIHCKPEKDLKTLAHKIRIQMEGLGFKTDRQNFVPHLSLGRMKKVLHMKSFQKAIQKFHDCYYQSMEVNCLNLYESMLLPKGPEYKLIKAVEFT